MKFWKVSGPDATMPVAGKMGLWKRDREVTYILGSFERIRTCIDIPSNQGYFPDYTSKNSFKKRNGFERRR